ncbi:hypothetical protein PEBR_37874 [Penicillium brasilianum]|uniref:Uncharacterized protein n=1 Tax=Penicillium brasilianum TaxID=104259 RepID=A0A1S9RC77_PENBI|nr:hypothetical protein PEBR_37874 [Penicillium brasilianum]
MRQLHEKNGLQRWDEIWVVGDHVTWAGEPYSYTVDRGPGQLPTGHAIQATSKVEHGQAVVVGPDSAAVIATLN